MGRLELSVSSVAETPMKRKMVQVDPEGKPHLTMTVSASVKFLKSCE